MTSIFISALKTLGVKKYNARPDGCEKDQISLKTFITEALVCYISFII